MNSTILTNAAWLVLPGVGIVLIISTINWLDSRKERRRSKTLIANREQIRRIEDLSLRIAEVDTKGAWFDVLLPVDQLSRIAEHRTTVLKSIADDMERYLQEANS